MMRRLGTVLLFSAIAVGVTGVSASAQTAPGDPFVSIYADYDSTSYVGNGMSGRWANVTPITDYRVEVFAKSDAEYSQGTFPLQANGEWTTGGVTVFSGEKIAKLYRVADTVIVAVSTHGAIFPPAAPAPSPSPSPAPAVASGPYGDWETDANVSLAKWVLFAASILLAVEVTSEAALRVLR